MRILVQRVTSAAVSVSGERIASIGAGLLLLVGIRTSDTEAELTWMAQKCAALRIFADEAGKLNKSVADIGGEILAVSQFTLYGDAQGGNRPGFTNAARPEIAQPLFDKFVALLTGKLGKPVPTGRFGADMQVESVNDGPVTIWLER
jgi:D-tyrosyl-tRNA(Tyr) deacylase